MRIKFHRHTRLWMLFGMVAILGLQTSQAAITFNFNYTDAAGTGWYDTTYGQTRRDALVYSANQLGQYFNATATIGYTVSSVTNPDADTLASASSNAYGPLVPGFEPTIVQYKIQSGYSGSVSYTDGSIDWNFGKSWSYSYTPSGVSAGENDFVSTAMHELLHSFGFISTIESNGTGALGKPIGDPDLWYTFDRYLTTSSGSSMIDPITYAFDPAQLGTLTGGVGAMRFNGTYATPTFTDGVPIYTPTTWSEGSSGSHTDDLTFNGSAYPELMMNAASGTGPGVRSLSSYEQGILKDIGYSMVPALGGGNDMVPEPGSAMLCLAGSFVICFPRRHRRGTA
ncbi:MAG: hypothetical protein WC740_10645 [Verrucomicrobiia bacterium]